MIKIGIYIPGDGLDKIDMTNPEKGNPGIGGTEYCELVLGYNLSLLKDRYECWVISHSHLRLPQQISNLIINNIVDLKRIENNFDILIIKTPRSDREYDILDSFKHCKIITWSHNYINSKIAQRISSSKTIVCNIFVSKQMYDFYIDDDIIKKSLSIFNPVYDSLGECERKPKERTLTFMGSLTLSKGIVELMRIWEIVESKCPDAQLNIIGGGNLYNRNLPLGKLGITDEHTESKIAKYITSSDGKIKSNIHFLGILGKEKYNVFLESSVGIVNPSARTETFGLGVIEMATAKLPVVTLNWNGYPDTAINNQTALLGNSMKGIAKNVIRLFNDKQLNVSLGEEGKRQVSRFSPKKIMSQWDQIIQDIIVGKALDQPLKYSKPLWNNYKYIRLINSFLRFKLKLNFIPSVVKIETMIHNFIKN